jgi:hypothetical protein
MPIQHPGIINLLLNVHGDCAYVEFLMGDAFDKFSLGSIIGDDTVRLIKNKEAFLVLNNTYESFHSIVPGLYKSLVEREQIDPKQVILLSNSADIKNAVKSVAETLGHEEFTVHWILELEMAVNQMVNYNPSWLAPGITTRPNRRFINLNRRWRPHRPAFVALLCALDILKHGHVSLTKSDQSSTLSGEWANIERTFQHVPEVKTILEFNHDRICDQPHLYLDVDDMTEPQALISESQSRYFHDSHIAVISETNFQTFGWDGGNRFFSEKTFKAIAFGKPFLLISVANSLPLFQKLGYKTFSPFIDESYDRETDDATRLWMIAKELERICNLDESSMDQLTENLKPICQHNFQILKSKKIFSYA